MDKRGFFKVGGLPWGTSIEGTVVYLDYEEQLIEIERDKEGRSGLAIEIGDDLKEALMIPGVLVGEHVTITRKKEDRNYSFTASHPEYTVKIIG